LDKKFWPAMAVYVVLAGVVWFTLDEGKTFVFGRPVEIRLIPVLVIGLFAFRTVVARKADQIRRQGDEEAEKLL
jgi:hypothetical protein